MTKFLGMCTGALALVLLLSTQAAAQTVTLSADLVGGEETPAALNTGRGKTARIAR